MSEFKKYENIDEIKDVKREGYKGYIYLFQLSNGTTKVGKSKSPYERLSTLYSHLVKYSQEAEMVAIYISPAHTNYSSNETTMHRIFASNRIEGTELFTTPISTLKATAQDLDFLDETIEIEKQQKESADSVKKFAEALFEPTLHVQENKFIENYHSLINEVLSMVINQSNRLMTLTDNFMKSNSVTDERDIVESFDLVCALLRTIKNFLPEEKQQQAQQLIDNLLSIADMACDYNDIKLNNTEVA